jgi:hypothetical protein
VRVKRLVVVVAIIAAICLAPGPILRYKIGRAVAAKMPELMAPARSYSAEVSGGVVGILRGRIDKMDICGRDVKMPNGVQLDRLDVGLVGVHFKPDQTVTKVEGASFTASVAEDDLNDYLAKYRPDLRGAHITLEPDKLTLTANPKVLFLRTPAKVEGTLIVVDGTKLYIILKRVSTRGIRVPGFVRGRIQHDVNPVLDTKAMGIGARLESVRISNGAITVTGTADVNKALAKG